MGENSTHHQYSDNDAASFRNKEDDAVAEAMLAAEDAADGEAEALVDAGGGVVAPTDPPQAQAEQVPEPEAKPSSPSKSSASPLKSAQGLVEPSLLTSIRSQDIDKRIQTAAAMIPKRIRHALDLTGLISIFTFDTLLSQLLEVESGEALLEIKDV